jgi:kynurenine formamidase
VPRHFIDLSVTLEDKPTSPPHHRPKIEYINHENSWESFAKAFPGVTPEQMPDGKAWATEWITITTHAGTHMDSPWHYHPTMNHALKRGGEPSMGIDDVPLDWCFRPGVKLDFRHLAAGYVVQPADIEAELERIGYALKPLDIVVANTAAAARYGQEDYWQSACGFGRAATLYLTERGVRVVGTDSYTWDAAFKFINERYQQSGDASIIWEGHKAGRDIGYFQMEKLSNLEQLPPFGFTVACFPVKIKHASAGWCRVVGIVDD